MLRGPREKAVFQFTIDVMDRNDGHFTLSKFSDSYVMRGGIRRNVAAAQLASDQWSGIGAPSRRQLLPEFWDESTR
jgi:hypothetical protein